MTKPTETLVEFPRQSARDVLTEVLRTGRGSCWPRRSRPRSTSMLRLGRRRLTRPVGAVWSATATCPNGRCKPRSGTSPCSSRGFGTAGRTTNGRTFRSAILPPYLRKTPSLEALYPWLYLKGLSTGTSVKRCRALLGADAQGLSATTITRLKTVWEQEYHGWSKRALAGRRDVYVWADGVYFNVRLEDTDNNGNVFWC